MAEPARARFDILRTLGEGGMGVVYEAVDRERGARVALKTLHALDADALLRFKREFRSLAALSHSNLVPLYELVVEGDDCFFTMELLDDAVDLVRFVRGDASRASAPSGARTMRHGRAPDVTPDAPSESAGRAVDLARLRRSFLELVDGVERLHQAGKLHRDLKPSNVLVRPDGRVVVLDFGLVAEMDEAEVANGDLEAPSIERGYESRSGQMSGTALYMAPEQAAASVLGAPCDWYAVGVMLFEALTGSLPFEGTAIQVIFAKQDRDAPRARSFDPEVPEGLDALAAALLSREPALRPSAATIRAALGEEVLEGADAARAERLPFVGRQSSLDLLSSSLDAVRAGATVLARVRGNSGAGKSALVEHFLAEEARTAYVLSGRCLEQETVPWKLLDSVIDALASLLLRQSEDERSALLPEGIGALARMFPVLGQLAEPAAGSADVDALRARAMEALASIVKRLALRMPVVVYVDDAQWGDASGIDLCRMLLEHGPPLLLLIGSRAEYEGRSAALERLHDLDRSLPSTVRRVHVEVGPLEEVDAEGLVRTLAPLLDEARVRWIVREGGGNPFFLQELARHAATVSASVPLERVGMDALIGTRVRSLDLDARALLEACAIAARPLPLRSMALAAGITTVTPAVAMALRRAGLARGTGPGLDDGLETFHDRVREVVAAGLSPARRAALHASLAGVLEHLHGIEPEAIAGHWEGAGRAADASRWWARAAAAAAEALTFDRAEDFARRALVCAVDRSSRVLAREQLVHLLTNRGRFAEAYGEGRAGLAEVSVIVPAEFSPPALIGSLARVALHLRGRGTEALRELPEAKDQAARDGVRLLAATMKAAFQVRPELCVTLANESVDLCLRHGNTPECAIGYMAHGAIFRGGIVGQHSVGHAYGRLSLELVERFDVEAQRAEVRFVVGYFATAWRRPLEEAEALFESALDAALRTGDDFHAGCAITGLAMSLTMRGAAPREILEVGARHGPFLEAHRLLEPLRTLEVAMALASQRASSKRSSAITHETDDALARYGSRHFAHFQLLCVATAHERKGELDQARKAMARATKLASESVGMIHSAEHAFLRAVLAERRHERAAEAWRLSKWARACPSNFAAKAAVARALASAGMVSTARTEKALRAAADLARATQRPTVAELAERALARCAR